MKTIRNLVGSCLIAGMAMTGAVHAQSHAEHGYCEALGTLTADLKRLEAAPPDSSMKEHRTLIDQIKQDAMMIEKTAARTRTQAGRQLVMSSRRLSQQARNMPDDMTLEQARSRMGDDLATVRQSAHQLATESGCPGALPGAEGHAQHHMGEGTHGY
jgi:hypothetical protein